MLDPHEPVIRKLIENWPEIKAPRVTELLRDDYGYLGSVDLLRKRLAEIRPKTERPAQRTGYRPAQVMRVDWAEMPTRPRIAGAERRVYALICSLPYSGASTAHFSFDMTVESFIEGHVHAFDWLGGAPRECVYDNLRAAVARREGDLVTWNPRFTELRGHYAFHATACTPETPREKGSVEGAVRHTKTGFWPARRFATLAELDRLYADWRDRIALPRRHASGHFIVADRLAVERESARALPPVAFGYAGRRASRECRSTATSSTAAASTGHRRRSFTSESSCASTATGSGSNTGARRWRATSAATARASGFRRRECGPSRRRRPRGCRLRRPR